MNTTFLSIVTIATIVTVAMGTVYDYGYQELYGPVSMPSTKKSFGSKLTSGVLHTVVYLYILATWLINLMHYLRKEESETEEIDKFKGYSKDYHFDGQHANGVRTH